MPEPGAPSEERFIERILDLNQLLRRKSHFLFGPRQTGKTSLVRQTVKPQYFYNLLESETYLSLSREPWRLRQEVLKPGSLVVVDEIQLLPALLNEIHWLIEERRARFLLTGSSARKLRRGGVNLLGGRARSRTLHPLVSAEMGAFDLWRLLSYGGLPSIFLSDRPEEDLRSYAGDYLREEIAHEGLSRSIPAFGRFLEVAALCSGKMINYTQIASDAQVPRTTVHEYFDILRDTLIAYDLPAWGRAKSRKPLVTSKFYFFDVGVARHIQGRGRIGEKSPDVGEAFEAWIFHELRSYVDYRGEGSLHYWRTTSGFEVDFVLNESIAIEVKSRRNITESDLRGLGAIREEAPVKRSILVSFEARPRRIAGVEVLPWREFLAALWGGDIV